MISSGCAGSKAKLDPHRILPFAPACMTTVRGPPVLVGDDSRLALARYMIALGAANANLKCSRRWYETVRNGYGAK
jgi:hypothetical protein